MALDVDEMLQAPAVFKFAQLFVSALKFGSGELLGVYVLRRFVGHKTAIAPGVLGLHATRLAVGFCRCSLAVVCRMSPV